MTDTGMKGRVKGLLGAAGGEEAMEQGAAISPQHQALQVLNLAQRTAEDHIHTARRQADKIHADGRAAAEQIVREAQAHAQGLRQEADNALSVAHAAAAQIARDAQAHAEGVQRNAEAILAEAQARADELTKVAQADADELKHRAKQRYEDVVGSLAARREALQQQIEALERFDREYRARLTAFMQNQLRALWVDQPHTHGEIDQPRAGADADRRPAGIEVEHRHASADFEERQADGDLAGDEYDDPDPVAGGHATTNGEHVALGGHAATEPAPADEDLDREAEPVT